MCALCGVLLLVLISGGCRISMPQIRVKEKGAGKEAGKGEGKNISANYNQMRLRDRSLVGPMCGAIQETADHIILSTTNAEVQRAALLWKIEGVPAMRTALFQTDPLTAVLDAWAFCFQMQDYFQTGPGKATLGESSAIAVAACQRMEAEMNRVVASMTYSGDVTNIRAFIQKWGAEHPIRYSMTGRETMLSRVLEQEGIASISSGEAVAKVAIAVDDINRRLDVYGDQFFRQGRWEAELFKSELMADPSVREMLPLTERTLQSAERVGATVERLAPSVERAVALAQTAPELIARERKAAIQSMDEELTRTIVFLQEERIAAMKQVTEERIAAMEELHVMLAAEHKSLVSEIELFSIKAVDHAFWRAIQLMLALMVFALVVLGVRGRGKRTKG